MTNTTAYFGVAEANAWLLEKFTKRTLWLALHTAEPTPLGDPATEVAGGGYLRQRIIFGTPAAAAVVNTNNLLYPGMPVANVTWLSIWTDRYAGSMVIAILQPGAQFVPLGGAYQATAGDVAVQL